MTSLEDAPEPIVGLFALRTFRVSANGFLLPLSFTSADWADGTCIARCGRGHAAPADGCTCGVYSLRDLRDLRLQYWTARRLVAVVALEGQTVEGTKGWRSQAARVIDVWTGAGRWGLPAEQDGLLRQNLPGSVSTRIWIGCWPVTRSWCRRPGRGRHCSLGRRGRGGRA